MRITVAILLLLVSGVLAWQFTADPSAPPPRLEQHPPDEQRTVRSTAQPSDETTDAPRTALPTDSGPRAIGSIHKLGRPLTDRAVFCSGLRKNGTRFEATAYTDHLGEYAFATGPGDFEISIPHASWVALAPLGQHFARKVASARITIDTGSIRKDFVIPGGRVEVTVRDGRSGDLIPGVPVQSDIQQHSGAGEGWKQSTDQNGLCVFDEIPCRPYQFVASARGLLDSSPITGHPSEHTPTVSLDVELQPAGSVVATLVAETGVRVAASAALRLVLQHNGTDDPLPPVRSNVRNMRPEEVAFRRVPAGTYSISTADERIEHRGEAALRYQSMKIVETVRVEAVAGQESRVTVPVRRRCHAKLRGTHPSGRCARNTTMRIDRIHDETSQRIQPAHWQKSSVYRNHHFDGFLAPGEYLVRFDGPRGQQWDARINVEYASIERTFPLPW